MICYTRNFEDVILQRVFADVPIGCYVDVGACVPIVDSNTYGLYTKGWAGLIVEPLLSRVGRADWERLRPRDQLIEKAIGKEATAILDFYVFEGLQTSTGSKASVDYWAAHQDAPLEVLQVPQTTLQQLSQQYLTGIDWHLLSIDVEGMEFDVIQGLDWMQYRPWVVVLEATWPGSPTPNHQQWEPWLLAKGYQLALFDGVNRFYVSDEKAHLLARFALPPNVWDRFQMYQEVQLREEVNRLQARIAKLT